MNSREPHVFKGGMLNLEPVPFCLCLRAADDGPGQYQVPGLGDPMVFEFQKRGSAVDHGGELHGSPQNATVDGNLAKTTVAGRDKYKNTIHENRAEWQWNSFKKQALLEWDGKNKKLKLFC